MSAAAATMTTIDSYDTSPLISSIVADKGTTAVMTPYMSVNKAPSAIKVIPLDTLHIIDHGSGLQYAYKVTSTIIDAEFSAVITNTATS